MIEHLHARVKENCFEGRKKSRLAEGREKLHTADINRKAYLMK